MEDKTIIQEESTKVQKTPQKNPRSFDKNKKRPSRRIDRPEKPRSEFEQKILSIRRVTRVVAGGRRYSYAASVVIGDKKGKVGLGTGKSTDTSLAIEKAVRDAKKEIIFVKRTENNSIPHPIEAKFKASTLSIRPSSGRGLVAGSSVRDVLEMAGITDVSSKVFSRSRNKLNNARAAVEALKGIAKKG